MFITAITFIAILSILVFVHEFGHYIAARIIGVHVEEFGFGLPPRIFGKKVKGTLYSMNLLPIGGFVKLAGEDEEGRQKTEERGRKIKRSQYFWARSKKERAIILLAGVTMNFLLAWGIMGFLLTRGIVEEVPYVRVDLIAVDSPAKKAGLLINDRIEKVSWYEEGQLREKTIVLPDDLIALSNEKKGIEFSLSIIRDGTPTTVNVIPRVSPPEGQGPMGIAISNLEEKFYTPSQIPLKSLEITFSRAWQMTASLGNLLYRLVTGDKVDRAEIAGPVGIAAVTGQAVKYGWESVLEFMSILSLNLALINVLPLPALDGGRMAFVVLEKFGKKARPDIERTIHQIGMMFLLALVALVTLNDILRLVKG